MLGLKLSAKFKGDVLELHIRKRKARYFRYDTEKNS